MRSKMSLKLFITLVFLLVVVVLIGGYSFLSIQFFRKGVDSITAVQMEETARSYLQAIPPEQRMKSVSYFNYHVATEWKNLPEELLDAFPTPPSQNQRYMVHREKADFELGEKKRQRMQLYFIFHYEENDQELFIGRKTDGPSRDSLFSEYVHESRLLLYLISGAIAIILGLSILLVFRRIAKPISALERWTSGLSPDNLEQPSPDFSYPELNKIAELVRSSLSSVQKSLEHEHRFLRYASHELRTPIAVIRNNIELIPKIEKLSEPRRSEEHEQLFGRIDRASLNMQHLTETLLWLYRDDIDTLPVGNIELDQLINQQVEEMKYLLDRKEIELKIETQSGSFFLPDIPTQIVLRNLIRNAFQHTLKGSINILQKGNAITVWNSQADSNEQNNLGFGFGLQLITLLTEKLGWKYESGSRDAEYRASVSFDQD